MSLDFAEVVVGMLEVNCYVLWDTDTLKAAIIDPGDDIDDIMRVVDSRGLDVEWILLTHGHFDHTFRVSQIAQHYNAKIGMQALDLQLPIQTLALGEPFYNSAQFVMFEVTDLLNDGDVIKLGESEIKIMHTPGHSQGGLCFVTSAGIFSGDTIFAGSVGRSDFPGGSHEQLIESIESKIMILDDSTRLFPGHGPMTTVGYERESNPYL
ncbi:MAG: MBL fold metallo-hydrolase [Armatimonadota bacterium]|nr:MBL fold metallo-hydrolase [bacterium]